MVMSLSRGSSLLRLNGFGGCWCVSPSGGFGAPLSRFVAFTVVSGFFRFRHDNRMDDGSVRCARCAATKQIREETIEEAMEEAAKPLSIAWPDTWRERLNYVALAPIIFPLWLTLPDVRREEKRKYVAGLFLGEFTLRKTYTNMHIPNVDYMQHI